MTNLDKAREWAESVSARTAPDGAHAAADLIQSLPDHWVDAEKVREVTDRHNDLIVDFLDQFVGDMHTDTWEAIRDFMCELNVEVDALAIPKLPTLADMTAEGREACQWMRAQTWHEVGIIVWVDEASEIAQLITRANGVLERKFKDVTPLPGPKLQWPGGGYTPTISNKEKVADDQAVAKDVCNSESNSSETPKSSFKPEDVPPNEPWLIELDDVKAIGTRYADYAVSPWAVAALNGLFSGNYMDSQVTLIHKLVPETPALPEGMRLADHAEYGRVVTSPRVDDDDDYKFFFLTEEARTGSGCTFAHESKLTFLDGGQHV